MRRDKDLIRELLLQLEQLDVHHLSYEYLHLGRLKVEGFSDEEILYHLTLMHEARLFETTGKQPNDGYLFKRLTNAGHDLLDSIRDPAVWTQTKKAAEGAGGFTIELLGDLAKGFIRKQIEDRTGIKL